jgi:hypothetical protein
MAVPTTKEIKEMNRALLKRSHQIGDRLQGLDTDGTISSVVGTALTGTTGDSFTLASGETDGKFAISVNTTGTNHTVTLKAPVTTQAVSLTLPDVASDTLVSLTGAQTMTDKTMTSPILTTPTIADFTNATHDHSNNANGGSLSASGDMTGTTNASFTVDSDSAAAKIALDSNSATGAFTATIVPPNLAANATLTLPATTGTLAALNGANTWTSTNDFQGNLSASSGNPDVDLSGSSGTFLTPTGAVTIGAGAISITGDATWAANKDIKASAGTGEVDLSAMTGTFKTPTGQHTFNGEISIAADKDLVLAKGDGSIILNADTTGSLTIIPTAATAQAVTLTTAAQTGGAGTITIPDLAGTTDTIMTLGLDQTMTGTLTIDDATTPILTIQSGNTNTGYIEIKGKTSGMLKILPADATAQTVTLATAAQTVGGATVTIPNLASVSDTFAFLTLAQTFAGVKTFTAAPVVTLDDTDDGVSNALTLTHSSSDNNAPAADGVAISFQLENATGTSTVEEWASIDVVSTTITNGSEDGDVIFNTMLAGTVTEAVRVDASDQSLTLGRNATDANGVQQLRIFPVTTAKGSLVLKATANTGDDVLTITNAAHGQATTLTIPDGGQAAASVVLTEGAATVNGVKTFGSMPIIPSTTKAAAGTVQGDATALATGFNLVTGADGTKGVVLVAAVAGTQTVVVNNSASILKVYPNTSDKINSLAVDTAISMAANTSALFTAYDAEFWYTTPTVPS